MIGPGNKVLITGGSGFLGSHLCRRLLESGAEVHASSRQSGVQHKEGVHWWQVDLTDLNAARALVTKVKPDVIYHLTGAVGASPARELVLPTFHSLLVSTVNLLTVVAETGCRRFILTGSLTEPQASHPEGAPGSPYAAAKWAGSAYGRMFHSLYNTPCVIVRPFMTYGPGQDSQKIIPSVTIALLRGEAPKLSSGRLRADWIYVDDVTEGFVKAAQVPGVDGATIDLGSGSLVSVRAVVEQIGEIVGSDIKPLFGALPDRPSEQVRVADASDAYARLGWKPVVSLQDGLERTVDWYRAQSGLNSHSKTRGASTAQ